MDKNRADNVDPHYYERWEEVIDGKSTLIDPKSIAHGRVSTDIWRIFDRYLHDSAHEAFMGGAGVYLSEREIYLPDMAVVCDPDKVQDKGIVGAPDLVVEVLSPGTAKNDRGHKKDIYERYGVREYWLVDPSNFTVEQYVLGDGKFVLREVYHKYSTSWLANMEEEERAAVVTEFKCSLYDDLLISLDEIFGRVFIDG